MRAITAAIAALGGGLLIAAFVVSALGGDAPEASWLLLGPLPFLAIGLAAYLRQPGRPVTENHWGVTSLATATIALAHHWLAVAAPVAAVGLIGLFPSGR
jgi:peptidoglycan/LPS O-acetylase OafA/YrhL